MLNEPVIAGGSYAYDPGYQTSKAMRRSKRSGQVVHPTALLTLFDIVLGGGHVTATDTWLTCIAHQLTGTPWQSGGQALENRSGMANVMRSRSWRGSQRPHCTSLCPSPPEHWSPCHEC